MNGRHEQPRGARVVWVSVVVGALLAVTLVAAACGGGEATVTTENDSLARWTELAPVDPLPQPRSGMTMVYDPDMVQVVMFGGWDVDTDFGDTWAYDPDAEIWIDLAPTGDLPPARALYQAVWDTLSAKLVLFGGTSDAGRFGDTWIYEPATNTWSQAGGAAAPEARSAGAMAYDMSAAKAVLFGGVGDAGRFDDTWTYDCDSDTWARVEPKGSAPSARSGHAMVFDDAHGVSILFGGYDGADMLNDTWSYDAASGTWTELKPAGPVPSARGNHRMVYDYDTGLITLFGGNDGERELADVWVYDVEANSWRPLGVLGDAPVGREEHAMVYDPSVGRTLVFGGFDDSDAELGDLWELTITL